MLRNSLASISGTRRLLLSAHIPRILGCILGGILSSPCASVAGEQQVAAPIPPPPESRALLPAPLPNVVMVRVKDGRLNVPLGGWGGQRLIQAKTDPEKFRGYLRAVKARGLNCVRPLFHPPNAAKANDAEWARFDWEAMDRAVAMTQDEGLYFLVDYHNWLVNDTIHVHEEEWLRTWGWLIGRYLGYQHLIFEGFNEPQNQCACLAEHYQKWINLARTQGARQLCVVSPFWGNFFGLKDPAANWAQCRHHYFSPQNSPSADKGRAEAEWHLANLSNKNSAASAVRDFGCGFFMTEGGLDGKPKNEAERAALMAGVQRAIDLCEQHGFGWCLWAHGDWADGFDTYGAQLKTGLSYPLITGQRPR
ncbi:exported hypothetical protein [Verrucomicrobia bacterium]|nr:exported hypothetical protein [Verrucomicrobiota bacterium]